MKKLLLKNWRDIKSKKAQFATLILLVALAISSYTALTSTYRDLNASYKFSKAKLNLADFTVSVLGAPKDKLQSVGDAEGVKAAQGRLIFDTGYKTPDKKEGTLRIIGIPREHRMQVDKLMLVEGEYLKDGRANDALVDKNFADSRKLKVGDKITAVTNGKKRRINVKGIVSTPEYLFPIKSKEDLSYSGEFGVVFMAQQRVEKLFNAPPIYNDFAVTIDKGADQDRVIKRVEKELNPFTILTTVKQNDQPSNFRVKEEIRQNKESADFMPGLVLVISSLSIFIALSRLVQSQRGQIGLSKALGYSNAKLLFHYIVFSLFIALAGALIGFAAGQYFAVQIVKIYQDFIHIPYLKHYFYVDQFVASVAMSAVACLLGGLIPAFSSVRMLPAEAMRSDPNLNVVKAKKPIIERAINTILPLPYTFKIPLRNIFRVKKRSFYTIIGITFALILTVATWSSMDIMDYLIDYQYNQVDKWDIQAGFQQSFSSDLVRKVEDFKGVKKVQTATAIPVKIKANGKSRQTVITAMKPGATFHGFDITEGKGAKDALTAGGAILTPRVAEKLDVKIGDKLTVKSPFAPDTKKIKLLAMSDEMLGSPVYVSLNEGSKLLGGQEDRFNILYVTADKKHLTSIKEKLFKEKGVTQIMVKSELADNISKLLESQKSFLYILLVFAFSVAFVITYNTFTTNILERSREIATMRTIGEDGAHLSAAITIENLLLALVGIPLGIYLGILATDAMFQSFSTEAYSFRVVIFPRTIANVVISIVIVLLLSEIPAIRRVFKLDLAEATKAIE